MNGKRVPTLIQLEKIAEARSQFVEELIAELYGRSIATSPTPSPSSIEDLISSLPVTEQLKVVKLLVDSIAGDLSGLDQSRKITARMVDSLTFDELITILELLTKRLKTLSTKGCV